MWAEWRRVESEYLPRSGKRADNGITLAVRRPKAGEAMQSASGESSLDNCRRSKGLEFTSFSDHQYSPGAAPQPFANWSRDCIPSFLWREDWFSCRDPSDTPLHQGR